MYLNYFSKLLKNRYLLVSILLFSNQIYAQIEGGNMPGLSTPKNVEASKLQIGSYVGDVNIFSGNYETSIPLGSVATPGGLSYSVSLNYNSKNIVSNNPEHVDGIPYGEGWTVSVPSISIKTESRRVSLRGRESYDWRYKKENFSNSQLYADGDSYYYYPFLNIPGYASGKLILKERMNNRSVFVLEKFEKYVQAEFYNGIWEVIMDDGTVFVFDYLQNNMRNPTNNRLDRMKYKMTALDSSEYDTLSFMDTVCVEFNNNVYPPACIRDSVYKSHRFVKRFENVLMDRKNDITKDLVKTIRPVVERTAWYPSQMYNPSLNHQMIYFEYETFGKINFQQEYMQNNFQFFFLDFVIDSLFHLYGNSVDTIFQTQVSVPDLSNVLPYMKSYGDFNSIGFNGNKPHQTGTVFRDIFLKSVIAADMSNGYIPIEKLDLNYETFDVGQYAAQNATFNTYDANMLLWKSNNLVKRMDSLYSMAPAYHRGVIGNSNFLPVNETTTVPFHGSGSGYWSRYRHLRSDEFLRHNMGLVGATNAVVFKNSNVFDSWTASGDFLNAHSSTSINWRNPYSASYNGKSYYFGREEIFSYANSISFDHSFIESERLKIRLVPGETYEIRTLIQGPNYGQKIMNFDVEVVTGQNGTQPVQTFLTKNAVQVNSTNIFSHLNNNYHDPELTNAQYKSHSIFSTFNNIIKWGFGWTLNNSGQLYTSNNFVLPNLPNDYEGVHVRIGPSNSDQYNNFGLWPEEWQNIQDPNSTNSLISDFGSHETYFTHFQNQKLNANQIANYNVNQWNGSIYDHADIPDNGHLRLWDTDPIPNNFGNGSPWYMIDKAEVGGASTNMYLNTYPKDYPHHRFWWNNFPIENKFCDVNGQALANFPNKPTLAGQNISLAGFQVNRISKNPYVLKNVKKYKLTGHYDYLAEYVNATNIWDNHLVELKEIKYDIWQLQIPDNEFDNPSGQKFYPDGNPYFRNVFILSEIRNKNTEDLTDFIATQFSYDTIEDISHQVPCASMFNSCSNPYKTVRMGNIILMSKITDEVGGETFIEYATNYNSIYTHGTGSPIDFSRFQNSYNENDSYLQDLPPSISMEVVFPVARVGKMGEDNTIRFTDYTFQNLLTDNGMLADWLFKINNINNSSRSYASISGYENTTVFLPPLDNSNPQKRARIEYEHLGRGQASSHITGLEDNHPFLLLGKVKSKSDFDEEGNLIKKTLNHYKATKAFAGYLNRRKIALNDVFLTGAPCEATSLGHSYTPGDYASAFGDYLDLNAINDNYFQYMATHKALLLPSFIADIEVSPFDKQKFVNAYFAPAPFSYFIRKVKEEVFDYYPEDIIDDNSGNQHEVYRVNNSGFSNVNQQSNMVQRIGMISVHSAKEYFYYDADVLGKSNSDQYKKLLRKGILGDSSDYIYLSDEDDFWTRNGYGSNLFIDLTNTDYSIYYRKNKSYVPSWQLSAVKSYSDDYAGAFTLEEKYYLFDLQKLYRYKTLLGMNPCAPGEIKPFGPKFTHKLKDDVKAIKFSYDNLIRNSIFQTVSSSVIPGYAPSKKYEFIIYDDYKSGIISIDVDHTDTVYDNIPQQFCDVLDPTIYVGPQGRLKNDYNLNLSSLRPSAVNENYLDVLEKDGTLEEYLWKEHRIKPKQNFNKREVLDNVFQNVSVLKSAHIAFDTVSVYQNNIYSEYSPLTVKEEFLFYEYGAVTDSVARPKIRHFPDGSWEFYDSMISVTYNKFLVRIPYPTIKYADIIGRNRFGQVMIMKDQNDLTTLLTFPQRDYTWFIDPNKYVKRYNWNGDPANGSYTIDSVKCAYRVMNFGRFGLPDSKTVGYKRLDSLQSKYSYNNKYRLTKSIDPNAMVTDYEYDGFGRLIQTKVNGKLIEENNYSYWNSSVTSNNSNSFLDRANENFIESFAYNEDNTALVSKIHYDPLGREFHSATNHFDFSSQNYTSNTIHSGTQIYDNWNRLRSSYKPFVSNYQDLDVEENITGYFNEILLEANSRGLALKSADFGESILGNRTVKSEYELIGRGGLQSKSDADNNIMGQIAPSSEQKFKKITTIDQDGKKSVEYINSIGQKVASTIYIENKGKINTYFVYDGAGNLHKTINDKGQVRRYYYNSLGLMYKSIDPDGGIKFNWYDDRGNVKFSQDANLRDMGLYGSIREFEYDDFGRLIAQNFRNLHAGIPENQIYYQNKWTYADSALGDKIILGNVLKKEKEFVFGPPIQIPNYVRDEVLDEFICSPYSNGKITKSMSYDDQNKLIESNYYFYNKEGLIRSYASQFNPDGIQSTKAGILNRLYYDYDRQGRLIGKTLDLGEDNHVDFNYSYEYDELGRLENLNGGINTPLSSDNRLVKYKYDNATGNLISKIYSFHNSNGTNVNIDSIYYQYEPKRERLKKIASPLSQFSLYYDDDTAGFQNTLNLPLGSPFSENEYLDYSSNFNGNINALQFAVLDPAYTIHTFYGFGYDKANRLVSADALLNHKVPLDANANFFSPNENSLYSIGDEIYQYDDIGNMVYKKSGVWPAGLNPVDYVENISVYAVQNNKLKNANGNTEAFEYDSNGNLKNDNLKNITIENGRANLPLNLSKNGNVTEYQYSAQDNRIYKSTLGNAGSGTYYFKDESNSPMAILKTSNQTENTGTIEYQLYGADRFATMKQSENIANTIFDYNSTAIRALSMEGGVPLNNDPINLTNTNLDSWLLYDSLVLGGGIISLQNFNLCKEIEGMSCTNVEWNSNSLEVNGAQIKLKGKTVLKPGDGFQIRLKPIFVIVKDCNPSLDSLFSFSNDSMKSMKFYHSDHLGNTRLAYTIENDNGTFSRTLTNVIDYYPFGKILREYNVENEKFKFTGKERDDESGYDYFEARLYDSDFGRFLQVDPLAHLRESLTPYNFVSNNPIMRIDPDGALDMDVDDWVERTDESGNTSIVWDENVTSANDKDLQAGDRYLGKAVVVFEGSENEKLGKGNNLFGEGANLAKATVYGPDGADDIKEYGAYTMSSDPSKYGTVADGEYNVYYDKVGKSGALKSNWAIEGRGNVSARNGVNPAFPNRNPGYLNGVFIHRSNNNGYAGGGVSKGCPLICPSYINPNNGWNEFNQQLQGVSQFKMILTRDKK